MAQHKQPHCWPIRIYYEDTDFMGIVYYANYLKYFERARTEFLRSLGIDQNNLIQQDAVMFAVRQANVDYLKPALFEDLLDVQTEIAVQKAASLVFQQSIYRAGQQDQILCTATVKIACLDSNTMAVKAIPKTLIEKLNHAR